MIESVRSATTTPAAQRPSGGSRDIRGAEAPQRVAATHAGDSPGGQDQSRMHGDDRHPSHEETEAEVAAENAQATAADESRHESGEHSAASDASAALARLIEEAGEVGAEAEQGDGAQEPQAAKMVPLAEPMPTGIFSRAATAYRTGLEIGGSSKRVLKPGDVYSVRL